MSVIWMIKYSPSTSLYLSQVLCEIREGSKQMSADALESLGTSLNKVTGLRAAFLGRHSGSAVLTSKYSVLTKCDAQFKRHSLVSIAVVGKACCVTSAMIKVSGVTRIKMSGVGSIRV